MAGVHTAAKPGSPCNAMQDMSRCRIEDLELRRDDSTISIDVVRPGRGLRFEDLELVSIVRFTCGLMLSCRGLHLSPHVFPPSPPASYLVVVVVVTRT